VSAVTHTSEDLYLGLQDFFEVCYAALADTPGGQPECAYVNEGPPAWDACPCLVCWTGAPAVGDTFPLQPALAPMHRIELGRQVNIVTYTAVALRCQAIMHEDGTLPQPPEHIAPTREINADMWAMWNWLKEAHRQGILFGDDSGKREFSLEPGIAYNPQGAAAGSAITCRVQLDGYSPDLSGLVLS
jgi:hypothetical protein